MSDLQSLLGALQHADSFFPGGGVAFSGGLETLHADREVRSARQLAEFVEGQLQHRWASCDASALVSAHRAAGSLERIAEVDAMFDAMTLATELREGSKRAGTSLLTVHAKLGTVGTAEYRALIAGNKAFGHLPVVQGLVWSATGMTENDSRAVSAHTLCTGLIGAALRLGMIGHLDAQKILLSVRPVLAKLLQLPVPDVEAMCAYMPATEIAAMRHEVQDGRLFAS
ncbi:MAG: urease accessory UreF family protein [Burkholderiales bacterium]